MLRRRRELHSRRQKMCAVLNSGQSFPVCSARSKLYGPLGCCACRCEPRVRERSQLRGLPCGTVWRGPCCTVIRRPPATGGSAYCSRIRTPWDRPQPRASGTLSQLRLCVKDAANCGSLTSLFSFKNEIVRLLEGPTSAPSAPPQYEGAPKLATAKAWRNAQAFCIVHSRVFQTAASL